MVLSRDLCCFNYYFGFVQLLIPADEKPQTLMCLRGVCIAYVSTLKRDLDVLNYTCCLPKPKGQLGRVMRKSVFWHMRTAKAQIRLRIRAAWSGPLLSACRIIGCYRMYQQKAMTGCDFAPAWDESCILRMPEDTYLLGAAQLMTITVFSLSSIR